MTIERDNWMYVYTDTPEKARKFFGVPDTTEVKLHSGERFCWAVKAPEAKLFATKVDVAAAADAAAAADVAAVAAIAAADAATAAAIVATDDWAAAVAAYNRS